jgi:hypothetical protein
MDMFPHLYHQSRSPAPQIRLMHVLIGIAFRTEPINKEITLNILARRPVIDSITVGGVDITPGEDLHIQWFADRGLLPIDPHRLYEEPLFGEFLSRAIIPSVDYAKWAAAVAQASWFDLRALDPSRVFIRPRRIADTVLLFPDDTSLAKCSILELHGCKFRLIGSGRRRRRGR